MRRLILITVVIGLFTAFNDGLAGSFLSNGTVASSSGLPDKHLRYEDFKITDDGFISGYIVNASDRGLQNIRLDAWTTDVQETRIFWRKTLVIGNLGPHGRYPVREPYQSDEGNRSRIKYMFRLSGEANFRNSQ